MFSFILSLALLVVGYMVWGRVAERIFGPDPARPTPAVCKADGVDYVVLSTWKVFMIQFLNIAGTGPIFGAIMGAWYGPAAYLWIVFGCIFAGSVHDYMSGMLSLRNDGAGLPDLVGKYLGSIPRKVMLVFSILLLMMVGVVFVYSPALILSDIGGSLIMWVLIIFTYYVLATLLPIDKIIGRFYPVFAVCLLFMAVALMVVLIIKMPALPEVWSAPQTWNHNTPASILGATEYVKEHPLFPCLFITIACGAISGFHATQSPMMARCLKNEKMGRPVFYGAMITEGVVALIWATVSAWFFYYGGWREVVTPEQATLVTSGQQSLIQTFQAPQVVERVCTGWLGAFGGILALIGVVAAPITSGDTAFRSARLIIAEALHVNQKAIHHRLAIAVPLFAVSVALLAWQMENPGGFNVIWRWFGWSNQTLSVFTLWTITAFLARRGSFYFVSLIPALFMTCVCTTYFCIAPESLHLSQQWSVTIGLAFALVGVVWFAVWKMRRSQVLPK